MTSRTSENHLLTYSTSCLHTIETIKKNTGLGWGQSLQEVSHRVISVFTPSLSHLSPTPNKFSMTKSGLRTKHMQPIKTYKLK